MQPKADNTVKKLWLNDNKLVNIYGLCKLKSLTFLKLSNNSNLDFESLNFKCWSGLLTLYLQNANFESLKNDYRCFAGLTKLFYLNLSKNNLKYFSVVDILVLPALEYLDISDNKLHNLNNASVLNTQFKNLKVIHTLKILEFLHFCKRCLDSMTKCILSRIRSFLTRGKWGYVEHGAK
jgi:Leucine-rich repeat (LRR) protein